MQGHRSSGVCMFVFESATTTIDKNLNTSIIAESSNFQSVGTKRGSCSINKPKNNMDCENIALTQKNADPAVEDEVDSVYGNIQIRGSTITESKTKDVKLGSNLQTVDDAKDIYLTPESRRRLCPTDDTGKIQDNACSEHPEKDMLEKISLKQGEKAEITDANEQFSFHKDENDETEKVIEEQAYVGNPARSKENDIVDTDQEAEVADGTTSVGQEKMTGSGGGETDHQCAPKVSNRMEKRGSPTLLGQDEESGNTPPDEDEAYLHRGPKHGKRCCWCRIWAIVMTILVVVAATGWPISISLMHKEHSDQLPNNQTGPCSSSALIALSPSKEPAPPPKGYLPANLNFIPAQENLGGFNVTENAISIHHSGDYLVCLKISFRLSESARGNLTDNQTLHVRVMRQRYRDPGFRPILEVSATVSSTHGVVRATTERQITLEVGDRLVMLGPGPNWMDFDKGSSYIRLSQVQPPEFKN